MICVSAFEWDIIQKIIQDHASDCDVYAFGSRYTWTPKDYSDLDLAFLPLDGKKLGLQRVGKLEENFAESDLPYRVDVVDYYAVSHEFRKIIDAGHEVIFAGRLGLKLGDICNIKHGFAFKGEYFCDTPTEYLLVTPGNFAIGGGFQVGKPKFYNGPIPADYILNEGDIIVTMTDLSKQGDTLGYSAIVPDSDKYLHNQRIGLVTINSPEVHDEYIYWIMRTWDYHQYIVNHASGSTVKHTSPKTISAYEVEIPAIDIQRKIADTLSAIDDKIANNIKINRHLEQMAQAIFKSWFVDYEPFGGIMPDDWKEGTIADFGDVVGGGTPSKAKPEYFTDCGIGWITPKDLSINKNKFIANGANDITEIGLRNSSARLMPKGTVLFSSRAPIGYIAIAKEKVCTNQGFKSIVPKENVGTAFIYYFLIENLQKIEGVASGSTFKEVSGAALKGIHAIIPDDETLRNFQEECASIFEMQKNLEAENAHLAALRDALLPRLMSGELPVDALK